MIDFLRRNQVLLASGLFLVLSLTLLTLNRGPARRVDPLGTLFLELMRPLQSALTTVADGANAVWDRYVALVDVEADNSRLREMVRTFEAERHRLLELQLENERLRRLLEVRREVAGAAIAARVIGKDASEWFRTFVIDRGERDGVAKGMAVVDRSGVVGRIIQVSPSAARVLLVVDHNSGVDALIQRSRVRAIVEGTFDGGCALKYVRRGEDVVAGDRVLTSGLDGIFPKGFLIGRVSEVTATEHGLFQVATVEPAVPFDTVEEVLVLVPREPRETLPEGPSPTLTEAPS